MSSLIDFPESKGLNRRAGNSKEEADDGEKEHPEATIRSPRKVRMVKEHRADQSGGKRVLRPDREEAPPLSPSLRKRSIKAELGGRRICSHYAMHLHNPPICNTIG